MKPAPPVTKTFILHYATFLERLCFLVSLRGLLRKQEKLMKPPVKKERVFRVIAEQDVFDFKFLAEQTGLSKGFLSKVLAQLCDKNLVVREGERFRVPNKEYLLREWALTRRKVFRSLRPLKLFFFVKTRIRELFEDYVISGPFAESLINGQTSGEEVLVYTTKLPKVDEYLSKRPNTFVFIHDEHVFYHSWKIRGWNLVSIPQLCADLLAQGIYADVALEMFRRWMAAAGA
jgi:hypothetical protein